MSKGSFQPSRCYSCSVNSFLNWFAELASATSNGTYYSTTEQHKWCSLISKNLHDWQLIDNTKARMRKNNRIRAPDAALHVHPTRRQVIAVEVGFSRSLENLFRSAQQFLDHGGAKALTSVQGMRPSATGGFSKNGLYSTQDDRRAIRVHYGLLLPRSSHRPCRDLIWVFL